MPRTSAARTSAANGTKITIEQPATAAGPQAVHSPAPAEQSPDIWSMMQSAPPTVWDRDWVVYLYRDEPKVSMVDGASGGYLQKFAQPFDIDDVRRVYGGRKFTAMLKGRDGSMLAKATFPIEADPIYDLRERRPNGAPAPASAQSNDGVLQQFVSVLREELHHRRENDAPNSATEEAIKMLAHASERAMEIVKAQVPQAAPPSPGLESVLMSKLLDKAFAPPPPPPDPMAQLTMFMTLFEKMDALRGGARAGSGGVLSVIAEVGGKLVDHVPGLLGELAARREADVTVARSKERTVELLRGQVPPNAVPVAPASPGAPRPAAAPPTPGGGLRTVPLDGSQPVDTTVSPAPPADPGAPPVFQASITADPAYPVVVKLRVCELLEDAPDPDATEEEQDRQTAEDIVTYLDLAMPGFSQQLVQHSVELTTQAMRGDEIMVRAVNNPRWPRVFQAAREFIKGGDEEKPARRRVM